jgi:DNA-binding CsgD family transcriptional regulator
MTTLSHLPCPTHGQSLHRKGTCVHCEPAAEPEIPPPPIKRRRAKPATVSSGLGRPRQVDLTPRERQLANLLASGVRQADIAARLSLSRSAVSSMLQRAMARVGVERTYELVRYVRGGA